MCYNVYTDMATIQKRKSRGYTYWSIVESRRVNGKPRPVILEYLGTAEALLKRLKEGHPSKVKTYEHGLVRTMLNIAEEMEIVSTINRHIEDKRVRDGFTVGASILLAALGRVGKPTSKRGWYEGWARHTSLSYLLGKSLSKLDSQHFWDQMEAVPQETIPLIEEDILELILRKYTISLDSVLLDMSNFFTYIASTNQHSSLAQRGRNKQKRMDLKQFGLLLLLSRQDHLPLFHRVYAGNLTDRTVFQKNFHEILDRFKRLCGQLEELTLIFDQGSNTKKTLKEVAEKIHFVGALSPHHHKDLIHKANHHLGTVRVGDRSIQCYRTRRTIWNFDLTCVVYISKKLYEGQVRGLEQDAKKLLVKLNELKEKLRLPTKKGKKRTAAATKKKVTSLISSPALRELIHWKLYPLKEDAFDLTFQFDEETFTHLKENWLGRRIIITNRHEWRTEEIILTYWGQSHLEATFKRLKNPYHLALRPQYHWTDQKVKVHAFICLLAFLLVMIAHKKAKEKLSFTESVDTLLEKLSSIRLATFIERPLQKTKGKYRAIYRLEDMDKDVEPLAEGMGITEKRLKRTKHFSVYNS
ncbi:IS1634 family transposase [Candidatus Aerophobetes bacterium]|nr:IS1634 family transposase [Candidatus Aerophobetes bacterium]